MAELHDALTGLATPAWPIGELDIRRYFGDPSQHQFGTRVSPAWAYRILAPIILPAPLHFAGAPLHFAGNPVKTISCHYKVKLSLSRILNRIYDAGEWGSLDPYAGCYCWRVQRGGKRLSTHSWAIAVDFGTDRNPRGQAWPDWPEVVMAAFRDEGWTHGLDFPVPDPMHWQACSGY